MTFDNQFDTRDSCIIYIQTAAVSIILTLQTPGWIKCGQISIVNTRDLLVEGLQRVGPAGQAAEVDIAAGGAGDGRGGVAEADLQMTLMMTLMITVMMVTSHTAST